MLTITLPPLRERGADILVLAEHFLRRGASAQAAKNLNAAAAHALLEFDWPGNVRQLENLMRSLSVTVRAPVIDRSDLQLGQETTAERDSPPQILELEFRPAIARLEKLLLQRALVRSGGNRAEAARRLGIHRQFLYAKLKEHGLDA